MEAHGFRCNACEEISGPLNSRGTLRKSCAHCRSRNIEAIEYPEHEKLQKVKDKSQAIGFFMDMLQMQGVHLMVWQEGNGEPEFIKRAPFEDAGEKVRSNLFDTEDFIENLDYVPRGWVSYGKDIQRMLADHFDIDYDELMREKDRMLEQIRAVNA